MDNEFAIKELMKENIMLLEFVEIISKSSCNEIAELCLACDALELLRKLGKEE